MKKQSSIWQGILTAEQVTIIVDALHLIADVDPEADPVREALVRYFEEVEQGLKGQKVQKGRSDDATGTH